MLAPSSSRLEIAYTATVLRGHERLRFRYGEGLRSQRIDAGQQRVGSTTKLATADYRSSSRPRRRRVGQDAALTMTR